MGRLEDIKAREQAATSRFLPWGETVENDKTLWKVHTYPSEPIVIATSEWFKGFIEKYINVQNAVTSMLQI